MDSETEYDFIKLVDRYIRTTDNRNGFFIDGFTELGYWIGGSSTNDTKDTVEFSDYITGDPGNITFSYKGS